MDGRKEFEAWAALPPREWDIELNGKDQGWPDQYRAYHVQCAWQAWQAAKQSQWNEIDYSKPETWPEPERQCIIVLGGSIDTRIYEFDAEFQTWDSPELDDNMDFRIMPTHWMYAPQFEGEL